MIESELINVSIDLITTVGFPIAVTGFLLWERMRNDKEQTEKIAEALNNNTKALVELQTMFKSIRGD